MTDEWSDEARHRLGRVAEERRRVIGTPPSRVLKSRQTWLRIMNGLPVTEQTLRQLEDALGWAPLAAEEIMRGGQPRLKSQGRTPSGWDAVAYLTEAGELLTGLAGTTDEERQLVLDLLERGRQRLKNQRDNGR